MKRTVVCQFMLLISPGQYARACVYLNLSFITNAGVRSDRPLWRRHDRGTSTTGVWYVACVADHSWRLATFSSDDDTTNMSLQRICSKILVGLACCRGPVWLEGFCFLWRTLRRCPADLATLFPLCCSILPKLLRRLGGLGNCLVVTSKRAEHNGSSSLLVQYDPIRRRRRRRFVPPFFRLVLIPPDGGLTNCAALLEKQRVGSSEKSSLRTTVLFW
jgi:hypothetical protein